MTTQTFAADSKGSAIARELIQQAHQEGVRTGRKAIEILEDLTGDEPRLFIEKLSHVLHVPFLTMRDLQDLTPAFDLLSFGESSQHGCVLVKNPAGALMLAIADPFNPNLRMWAQARLGRPFQWYLVHHADLTAYLSQQEEALRALDGVSAILAAQDAAEESTNVSLSLSSIQEDNSPIIKLVNSTIYDALKLDTSDIHFEATATGLTIKYRIDGTLGIIDTLPGIQNAAQAISRIKVLAELDISEKRVPQDGRFKIRVRDRIVDLRVSIMPSIFGEDAVLRILDKQYLSDQLQGLRLESLGFDGKIAGDIRRMARKPHGMILVTGPTGSGKTTTLYATLSEINNGQDKIVTIEDPVEYQLPGVLQIPVNEKKGLTFARGLRSILRHDPDKVMVGEVRDPETAQIAIQSALTGHLVFTTIHANNAFDVIGRFLHMGIDPYHFVSALNGIVAQRLVRINCDQCLTADTPSVELLKDSGIPPDLATTFNFKKGLGCGHCRGTGYKGRKAIAEVLTLTDEIREMLVAKQSMRHLKTLAQKNGMAFLREAAIALVRNGETTLQEVNRVTLVE